MKSRLVGVCSVMPLLLAAAMHAQAAQRTFVASAGSDANPCSLASPCRSFGAALAQTDAGGEIVALDSAGYGPVTIDKSVAIVAPAGIYAGITAGSGANGVNVDGDGIDVALRGLTINGSGGGIGINIVRAAHVYVDRCIISHFGVAGIEVSFPANAVGEVRIVDSTVRANTSNGLNLLMGSATVIDSHIDDNSTSGIAVKSGRISVQRGSLSGNASYALIALPAASSAFATVSDSVIEGSGFRGLAASADTGTARLIANGNAISDTGSSCDCDGIRGYASASASALVAASRNVVTRSAGRGLNASGPYVTFYTYGDNLLPQNASGSTNGTLTSASYE